MSFSYPARDPVNFGVQGKYLADLLMSRVDNWRSRIYKRSCSQELQVGRKREIELDYLMLIIPLKVAIIIWVMWYFMP